MIISEMKCYAKQNLQIFVPDLTILVCQTWSMTEVYVPLVKQPNDLCLHKAVDFKEIQSVLRQHIHSS